MKMDKGPCGDPAETVGVGEEVSSDGGGTNLTGLCDTVPYDVSGIACGRGVTLGLLSNFRISSGGICAVVISGVGRAGEGADGTFNILVSEPTAELLKVGECDPEAGESKPGERSAVSCSLGSNPRDGHSEYWSYEVVLDPVGLLDAVEA